MAVLTPTNIQGKSSNFKNILTCTFGKEERFSVSEASSRPLIPDVSVKGGHSQHCSEDTRVLDSAFPVQTPEHGSTLEEPTVSREAQKVD